MKKVLYVCDFNSIHSRNLISTVRKNSSYDITVLSSYAAQEMEGVKVLTLNNGGFGDKSSFEKMSRLILKLSPMIYRFIITLFLVRRTKSSLVKLTEINLPWKPDVIHALRTQPEGIIASALNKTYKAQFLLTTWGQDFILWSNLNRWLFRQTKNVLENLDIVLPDNFRDERIIKTKYGQKGIESIVLPATGGLDLEYLDRLTFQDNADIDPNFSFLTTRGYENAYVKLIKVLSIFQLICKDLPNAHLYVDLNSQVNYEKDNVLAHWIEKRNLNKRITLLHLSREDMFSYMSQCKYHVSATYSDGLPLSLLESLYFGQIPIVFKHESTEILEKQFEHLYTFDSFKVSRIERKWRAVVNTKTEIQDIIARKNRKVIEEHYARKDNVLKIMNLYH